MRCVHCRHSLRGLETGYCPGCGQWFSTGAEIIPLVRRLRCRLGPWACAVCGLELTARVASRCPRCSSRFASPLPAATAA